MVAVLADPVFEADDPRVQRDAGRKGRGDTGRRHGDKPAASSDLRIASATAPLCVPTSLPPRVPRSRVLTLQPPLTELQRATREVGLSPGGFAVPRLLATRQEAEAILSVAPQSETLVALGFNANRTTAISPELGQYRIVHFATHGLINSEHPGLSGLVLSLIDEEGKPQDGFLRLHDIYNLNLPVDLVVLSACRTALGKEIKGEGLVGLVRGFLYAGAARVVASLWKVDDEATAELMKHFYQEMLQKGTSPAAALQAAQIAMWQQKRWQAPYYWAAFVIQGEWR